MKMNRVSAALLPFALAGLLLAGGCKKQDQQASNEAQPAAPAPAAPAAAPASAAAAPSTAAPAPAPAAPAPAAPAPAPAAPAPPPPPPPIVVPAGTHIAVTTTQDLGSKISQPGQSFSATVASPVVINGVTVIRAGSTAVGTVIDAKPLGRFKGGASL